MRWILKHHLTRDYIIKATFTRGKQRGVRKQIGQHPFNVTSACLLPALRTQKLLEKKLKTSQGKFLIPKILDVWKCTTSVTFLCFRSASRAAWPILASLSLMSSFNLCFFSFWFVARAHCNLRNDQNDTNSKSFPCGMSSKSVISKIANWKSVIYETRIHAVNSTGQKDKSVSSSLA